jgi:hypothetical protein
LTGSVEVAEQEPVLQHRHATEEEQQVVALMTANGNVVLSAKSGSRDTIALNTPRVPASERLSRAPSQAVRPDHSSRAPGGKPTELGRLTV